MDFVIGGYNVYGDPVVCEDSTTNEVEAYTSLHEAQVECARLNEYTEGGYVVFRRIGCALERVSP